MIRKKETVEMKSSNVIIIEGHLIFCNQNLRKMMDLKIFIDADDDVRLSRRVMKMSRKNPNYKNFLPDLLYQYE